MATHDPNFTIPEALAAAAAGHFRLLERVNSKRQLDNVTLSVSGYEGVMYLIADLVKVSILALEASHPAVPDPAANISGVLSVIPDLLPYEEASLLDKVRNAILSPPEEDWDFILESVSLRRPLPGA